MALLAALVMALLAVPGQPPGWPSGQKGPLASLKRGMTSEGT